ncbi:hypothetical protein OAH77_04490 [Flavobacteriaceae bacterium]|nr:hypothetical protein [Flavobacteriaceae bacterium]
MTVKDEYICNDCMCALSNGDPILNDEQETAHKETLENWAKHWYYPVGLPERMKESQFKYESCPLCGSRPEKRFLYHFAIKGLPSEGEIKQHLQYYLGDRGIVSEVNIHHNCIEIEIISQSKYVNSIPIYTSISFVAKRFTLTIDAKDYPLYVERYNHFKNK